MEKGEMMKELASVRLAAFLLVSLTLGGLVFSQPTPASAANAFDLSNVQGRYVSAENAYDTSSVHAFASPDSSLVGPPIFFAATAVMVADGKGNVCGEADGFYSGVSAPGSNLGPSLFHGTYSVEQDSGRITIETVSDGAPSPTNKFCATTTPIDPSAVTKIQVGYLQDEAGTKITTVEQVFGNPNLSSGFLSHARVWTKSGPSAQSFPPGPPAFVPGPPQNPGKHLGENSARD